MVRYVSERHIVIDGNPTPVPFWEPGRGYEGKTVIVLGGGSSLNDLDINSLHNHCLIAINSSCRKIEKIATKEDILYFSDNSWNERWPELANSWPGKVVTSNRNTKARLRDQVLRLDLQNLTEFMQVKSDYVQASSGHSAVCLACMMGAKRIILIGFECGEIENRTHWHNDYEQSDMSAFEERYLPAWTGLSKRFRELGCEVINSTPNSNILDFSFLELKEALELV